MPGLDVSETMSRAASSIALGLALVGCDNDAAPKGEGSTTAGARMLAEISKVPVGTVPPGYTRFEFDDGSWIAIRGIDSHRDPDGGTVAVVTDSGDSAVFFTHVCGSGPTPLESLISSAESAPMALEKLQASANEHKR